MQSNKWRYYNQSTISRIIKAIENKDNVRKLKEDDFNFLRDHTDLYFLGGYTLTGLIRHFEAWYDETLEQLSKMLVDWNHTYNYELWETVNRFEDEQRVKDTARRVLFLEPEPISANRYYHYFNLRMVRGGEREQILKFMDPNTPIACPLKQAQAPETNMAEQISLF